MVWGGDVEINLADQYLLTVGEASKYFRLGETKLRKLIAENKDADYLIWNGTRPLIKRSKFEKLIDELKEI